MLSTLSAPPSAAPPRAPASDRQPAADITALLQKVFAGDRGATRDFTERILLPILDAAVSSMLSGERGRRFEKSDVIQEVFQHLYRDDWRRLRAYDAERGALSSYVWAITSTWLRDHARRLLPPRPVEDIESERSPDSGPLAKAELGELIGRLRAALTQDELALFQWVYLEGAPRSAAAERLGIEVEAAHKRVQRMEAKIRAILSGDGPAAPKRGDP